MEPALKTKLQRAVKALRQGLIIAYPTEAVYGLGCDPQQPEAIEHLIKLKQRDPDKGLILIASKFEQLNPYLQSIDEAIASQAKADWPGAVTWAWPVKKNHPFSALLTGQYQSIAVRVTAHPVAAALCEAFQGAIVSTSANRQGQPPAKTVQTIQQYFPNQLAEIVEGELGGLLQPTSIYDVMTQTEIR
ncbi:Sua5/YciO/YrdC/YwlC family protein [Beggiatoa alba]|nr:Sua5/YciO/YrdC/YwlC family protein [Beggiatoa alba]